MAVHVPRLPELEPELHKQSGRNGHSEIESFVQRKPKEGYKNSKKDHKAGFDGEIWGF